MLHQSDYVAALELAEVRRLNRRHLLSPSVPDEYLKQSVACQVFSRGGKIVASG